MVILLEVEIGIELLPILMEPLIDCLVIDSEMKWFSRLNVQEPSWSPVIFGTILTPLTSKDVSLALMVDFRLSVAVLLSAEVNVQVLSIVKL